MLRREVAATIAMAGIVIGTYAETAAERTRLETALNRLDQRLSSLNETAKYEVDQLKKAEALANNLKQRLEQTKAQQDALAKLYESNQPGFAAKKQQLIDTEQELGRKLKALLQEDEKLSRKSDEIERMRRGLNRTNRSAVQQFNQRVHALEEQLADHKAMINNFVSERDRHKEQIAKYNAQVEQFEKALHERARDLVSKSAKDHADWREALRLMSELGARREQANIKRIQLQNERKELQQQLASTSNPSPPAKNPQPISTTRKWFDYDDSMRKSYGTNGVGSQLQKDLRDAQEDKRKADEEKKRLEDYAKDKK